MNIKVKAVLLDDGDEGIDDVLCVEGLVRPPLLQPIAIRHWLIETPIIVFTYISIGLVL